MLWGLEVKVHSNSLDGNLPRWRHSPPRQDLSACCLQGQRQNCWAKTARLSVHLNLCLSSVQKKKTAPRLLRVLPWVSWGKIFSEVKCSSARQSYTDLRFPVSLPTRNLQGTGLIASLSGSGHTRDAVEEAEVHEGPCSLSC